MSVVRVRATMCDTCIFRKGNLMHLSRGRVAGMVRDAKRAESCIPCHEGLTAADVPDAGAGHDAPTAVAVLGFYDRHATAPLQIAQRLGLLSEVTPLTDEAVS